eukprot:1185802-Prorocentrum_minimum.AAC.3
MHNVLARVPRTSAMLLEHGVIPGRSVLSSKITRLPRCGYKWLTRPHLALASASFFRMLASMRARMRAYAMYISGMLNINSGSRQGRHEMSTSRLHHHDGQLGRAQNMANNHA